MIKPKKKIRQSRRIFLPLILAVAGWCWGTMDSMAQTTYTNTSTSGEVTWLSGPNWSTVPLVSASNSAIRFQGALVGNLSISQNTGTNFMLNSLVNANTGAFAMNSSGGAFEFSKNGTINPTLTFANAATTIQTFSNNLVINDMLSVSQAGGTVSNSTIAGLISGVGGVRKSGNGYVYITGTDNNFGGSVIVSAGTLFVRSIGNAGVNSSLGTNGTIALGDGSSTNALRTINVAAETSDKVISLGGSTLDTRIENYSGGVLTLNGAINTVTNPSKILFIVAKSNSVVLGGPIATNQAASNNLAISLTNSAGYNLVLTASNAYRGGTTIWSGNLSLSNNSALGTGALTWQANGSLIALATLDISNSVALASGTGTAGMALTATGNQSLTNKISGVISGPGGLRLNSAGVTAYPANSNNSFSGGFFLQQGTLAVAAIGSAGNNSPLGTSDTIYLGTATNAASSAYLKYLGNGEETEKKVWLGGSSNTTFSSIDQSGQGLLRFTSDIVATNLGPKTLFLEGSSSGEGELAGVIPNSQSSTVSVGKRGSGTWTLSGTNTFSGGAEVLDGTLVLKNRYALASGNSVIFPTNGTGFGKITVGYAGVGSDLGNLLVSTNASIDLGANTNSQIRFASATNWGSNTNSILTIVNSSGGGQLYIINTNGVALNQIKSAKNSNATAILNSEGLLTFTNPAPTNSKPVVTAAQAFSVSENAPFATTVGTVVGTDADANPAFSSWTIVSGNTGGVFGINPANGQITVVGTVNFEGTASYALGVTVSDGMETSAVGTVVISVINVPEYSDFFGSSSPTADDNGDGISNLMAYALGATSPSSVVVPPGLDTADPTKLTITALIRINDPKVSVVGEYGLTLGNWETASPIAGVDSSNQAGAVAGVTKRQDFSVLRASDPRKFLHLKATQSQ
jgi:autotransporter-associated beta strand protein